MGGHRMITYRNWNGHKILLMWDQNSIYITHTTTLLFIQLGVTDRLMIRHKILTSLKN